MWKNIFFISGNYKKGLQVCIGKWKMPFEQVAWGEANLAITLHGCDQWKLVPEGTSIICHTPQVWDA
jgi:hypothetical protein